MLVAACLLVRDEEKVLPRALKSLHGFSDEVHVLDTGSTDGTVELAASMGAQVSEAEWAGFGEGRTQALALARHADWILMLDADQTLENVHPGMKEWLAGGPSADILQVEITDLSGGFSYRLPRLLRGGIEWRYEGITHEALVTERGQTPLNGMKIVNHDDGAYRPVKHQTDLALLAPGVEAGDPRAIYYSAQALWCLGQTETAAEMYAQRAAMGGWEEERWHAQYMAARLRKDIPGLLAAHRARPWRHEPLHHAAKIVEEAGSGGDVLFMERTWKR